MYRISLGTTYGGNRESFVSELVDSTEKGLDLRKCRDGETVGEECGDPETETVSSTDDTTV